MQFTQQGTENSAAWILSRWYPVHYYFPLSPSFTSSAFVHIIHVDLCEGVCVHACGGDLPTVNLMQGFSLNLKLTNPARWADE